MTAKGSVRPTSGSWAERSPGAHGGILYSKSGLTQEQDQRHSRTSQNFPGPRRSYLQGQWEKLKVTRIGVGQTAAETGLVLRKRDGCVRSALRRKGKRLSPGSGQQGEGGGGQEFEPRTPRVHALCTNVHREDPVKQVNK